MNGLSIKELAERLTVNTTTIQGWEQGKHLPHQEMMNLVLGLINIKATP
ncbi:DNA-binding transcriptional regulator YiaG [Pedobacter sp. UYP24]